MASSDVQRKLTAILCADVAGYSRLMGDDHEGTLATLTEFRSVFAGKIAEHHGRVVNAPGDSILAEFASVLDTVACAVEIQQELGERNQKLPDERRMHFRIGINLGDVLVKGGDIFGDGVNVAARLESLAKPGEICISGKAHQEVKNRLPLQFVYGGEQKVKNIAEPVKTYRVASNSEAITGQHPRMERFRKAAAHRGFIATFGFLAAILLLGGGWLAWDTIQQSWQEKNRRETGSALPLVNTSGDPDLKTMREEITGMEFVWLSGGTFEMGCGPWNG